MMGGNKRKRHGLEYSGEKPPEPFFLERIRHLWSVALWFHEFGAINAIKDQSVAELPRACIAEIYRACIIQEQYMLPVAFWRHVCYSCLHLYSQFPYESVIQSFKKCIPGSKYVVDMDKVFAKVQPESLSNILLTDMDKKLSANDPISSDIDMCYHIQCGSCKFEAIWRYPESMTNQNTLVSKASDTHTKAKPSLPKRQSSNLQDFLSFMSK
jgi:hypothetical protein